MAASTSAPIGWNDVDLGGRGVTHAVDLAGPPGAPAVVLLHGWTASGSSNWAGTCDALARHYRVLALDHRGHGRGVRARFTLEDCADDVIALLDAAGVERATLIGYSMGGPIAQLAWQRHPERVEALVFYATAAHFSVPASAAPVLRAAGPLLTRTLTLSRPALLSWLRPALTIAVDDQAIGPYDDWLDAFREHHVDSILDAGKALIAYDARPWVGTIDVPAAVIVTARDRVVSPDRQVELAAALHTTHVIEADGTHTLPFSDPVASSALVLEACRQVVPRPRARRRLLGQLVRRLVERSRRSPR